MVKKIAIVGYGVVGKHLEKRLLDSGYKQEDIHVYDPAINHLSKDLVNSCDIAFICVPTPHMLTGRCNISIVEESVEWLQTPLIVIRSTIEVGTTEYLTEKHNKRIVFQPEFLGETIDHPMNNDSSHIILGGNKQDTQELADFYQTIYNAYTIIAQTDSRTAELLKYTLNCYFATKITFCNEMYDIAKACNVDYHELRNLVLLDKRITPSHTSVYPEKRGFDGKCLPKDLKALLFLSEEMGIDTTLLKAVNDKNEVLKR